MKRIFLTYLFIGIALLLNAQKLKVHVFSNVKARTMVFAVNKGGYAVYANKTKIADLGLTEALYINVSSTSVKLRTNKRELGVYKKVWLYANSDEASFKLLPFQTKHAERHYPGNLQVVSTGSKLKCINEVELEQYLPGVIAAEAGPEQKTEYYKIQAIISRTYALKNLDKHAKQWFNVCDRVHCQVYKGLVDDLPDIQEGVEKTKGVVLVDKSLNYVSAVFHSNCGGHTVNSEDVWVSPMSYLKGVPDTFCLNMPHATWQMSLPKREWLGYLAKNYSYPTYDSVHVNYATNFIPQERDPFFINKGYKVPLKYVRRDWKLRSTFFAVKEKNAEVSLFGRGFGHGVGLCQEGAMGMVNHNYPYYDIIHYYFKDVYLIHENLRQQLKK